MSKVRIYTCLDKHARVMGVGMPECLAIVIGGFLGAIIYAEIGAIFLGASLLASTKVLGAKNKKGYFKKQLFYFFPYLGSYGVLKLSTFKNYL